MGAMGKGFTRGGFGAFAAVLLFLCVALGFLLYPGRGQKGGETPAAEQGQKPFVRAAFKNLPESGSGFYRIWFREDSGGAGVIADFRVSKSGTIVGLAGEPLSDIAVYQLPPSGAEIFIAHATEADKDAIASSGIISGRLSGVSARLDFTAIRNGGDGKAVLKDNGIWFAESADLSRPGLKLKKAPAGFKYAGWVTAKNGEKLAFSLFADAAASDDEISFGTKTEAKVPGTAFLGGLLSGWDLPASLTDGRTEVLVSLEPLAGEKRGDLKEPSLTLMKGRIPFKAAADAVIELSGEPSEKLPSGEIEFLLK